jgi:hypothetical protein
MVIIRDVDVGVDKASYLVLWGWEVGLRHPWWCFIMNS